MKDNYTTADQILGLIRFLSQDPLGTADIAAHVGPVVREPGGLLPIELRPILPGVRSARLACYPDSGLPYSLELALDSDLRLTPATLKPILGNFDHARTDRSMPREILFYPKACGSHWRIVVIAQLESRAGELDALPIANIVFRRDSMTP